MAKPSAFADVRARLEAGTFGMWLFLASLAMIFASSLVGYAVVRVQLRKMWPGDLPPLPRMLMVSTVVLLLGSATIEWAVRAVRRDDQRGLRLGLALSLYLGLAFLLLQTWCWLSWLEPISSRWDSSAEHRLALSGFFVLTGLHALHVIGGLVPLAMVSRAAVEGRYSAAHHGGVRWCAMYWHFLDTVWLLLYAALLLGS